jgi:hypothetical protein
MYQRNEKKQATTKKVISFFRRKLGPSQYKFLDTPLGGVGVGRECSLSAEIFLRFDVKILHFGEFICGFNIENFFGT